MELTIMANVDEYGDDPDVYVEELMAALEEGGLINVVVSYKEND